MGLTPVTLWLACLLAVRNQRILTAWDTRQADDAAEPRPPPAQNPAPPPQDPHQPDRRSAAITPAPPPAAVTGTPQITPTTARRKTTCCPEQPPRPGNPALNPAPAGTREHPARTKMSDPNVNISAGQTKTLTWS